jgi:hypothetical protein
MLTRQNKDEAMVNVKVLLRYCKYDMDATGTCVKIKLGDTMKNI